MPSERDFRPEFDSFRELDFQVPLVSTFPWPVVANYHEVVAAFDDHQAIAAAWRVRDAWELLIRFLATIGIIDARVHPADGRIAAITPLLFKSSGVSMGDWVRMLELSAAGERHSTDLHWRLHRLIHRAPRRRFVALLAGGDEQNSFVAWRNRRFGHGVFGPGLEEFAIEASRFVTLLHEAYELAAPLLGALQLESDSFSGDVVDWNSSSPLPAYHAHELDSDPGLGAVRLRLRDGDYAADLRPLLALQRCSACGRYAAFYFDQFRVKQRRAWFLDFDDGHRFDRRNVSQFDDWPLGDAGAAPTDASEPANSFFDDDRFTEFQRMFLPPTYLADEVAVAIKSADRGLIVLTGEGGIGKSWFCRGLGRHEMLPQSLGRPVDVLTIPLQAGNPESFGSAQVAQILGAQIKRRRWLSPRTAFTDAETLTVFLRDLVELNQLSTLVVCFDGLDELNADSTIPVLIPSAERLPVGCYLMLTTRPQPRENARQALSRIEPGACRLDVAPSSTANLTFVRNFVSFRLRQRRRNLRPELLPEAWAEPIVNRSRGLMLYAAHFCHALHFGVYDDVESLPEPADYYPEFFSRLRNRVGESLFLASYVPVLARVASRSVAMNNADFPVPVPLNHLGVSLGRQQDVLSDLAGLLAVRRDDFFDEPTLELGHSEISKYLLSDEEWRNRIKVERECSVRTTLTRLFEDPHHFSIDRPEDHCLIAQLSPSGGDLDWLLEMPNRVAEKPHCLDVLLAFGDTFAVLEKLGISKHSSHQDHPFFTGIICNQFGILSLVAFCVRDEFVERLRSDRNDYTREGSNGFLLDRMADSKTSAQDRGMLLGLICFEKPPVELSFLVVQRYRNCGRQLAARRKYSQAIDLFRQGDALLVRLKARLPRIDTPSQSASPESSRNAGSGEADAEHRILSLDPLGRIADLRSDLIAHIRRAERDTLERDSS